LRWLEQINEVVDWAISKVDMNEWMNEFYYQSIWTYIKVNQWKNVTRTKIMGHQGSEALTGILVQNNKIKYTKGTIKTLRAL